MVPGNRVKLEISVLVVSLSLCQCWTFIGNRHFNSISYTKRMPVALIAFPDLAASVDSFSLWFLS